ncbi:hypothetical protein ACHQM5_030823 [Ranunculus cassubicifolius]
MDSSTINSNPARSRKTLTNEERRIIYETLLTHSENGNPKYGVFKNVAAIYSVNERTVRRIWERAKTCIKNGLNVDVSHNLTNRVGRKRVEIDPSLISEIPLRKRTNIRSLAKAANMAKSTVHKRIQEGLMKPHSNALKPTLTDNNKKARLSFCLSMLEAYNHPQKPIFSDMRRVVHIDEKWFYMTKESQKYYLLPEEEEPTRTCKSKRFITKIMFLAAVARPRYDLSGTEEFSGKIGIFPFTYKEPAKRNSKNRLAGTLETKSIVSVTKEVI